MSSGTNWYLVGAAAVLVALMAWGAVTASPNDAVIEEPAEFNGTAVEQAALERINNVRTANGREPLAYSVRLTQDSRVWSRKMAFRGSLSHANSSAFVCRSHAENVLFTFWRADVDTEHGIKHFDTNKELGRGIANQWLNSSGHRKNIMRKSFESTGVGVYMPNPDAAKPKVYATQRFCG